MRIHIGTFGEHDAVKNQREFFRKLAVERGHDYFYSMGADTIPPLDALERLVPTIKMWLAQFTGSAKKLTAQMS
jgi:hypothetical protein